ncbi:tryptophan halogenase [Brevundimonas sp. Leaf363]|uniref:tryptophan halogenase family protein n=1 Tax=Brevundimonas sp. Leaf363 TaxID=1736353 RepID=UPI0006F3301D|nr:tryptophan halogenase family protein [Brevundimonas sp. Leaf363]KQS55376.1 tryptophan halogenase [Brevundimonas sp. Leaf363]
MTQPKRTRVVIAGGGTAGWLAAALLTRQLGPLLDVTLVESEQIGTVGVGESTIPTVTRFHALIGVEERGFMTATGATFKLGISFEGWGRTGDRYIHSFGDVGKSTWMGDFQHFWLEARDRGVAGALGDYCFEHQAADAGKFAAGGDGRLNYAYHLDAGRYARFLRAHSEAAGLTRVEGKIETVERDAGSGVITALALDGGRRVEGDVFLDCTGFRGLLIGDAMGVGFEDWGHWLPTNRALAVQTVSTEPAAPYTRAIAHDAGWRWKIPLQHRVGNGLVYASDHLSDDEAQARLLSSIDGERLIEPGLIRFRTGRRLKTWEGNCIALSLAAGFVEPLESTSIHLIMTGLARLVQAFPFDGISPAVVDRFNAQSREEMERIRDFIVLHYHLNQRDEPFWKAHRENDVPQTLKDRLALFGEQAQAYQAPDELFRVGSWMQVMLGQNLTPRAHHAMARMMPTDQLAGALADLKSNIDRAVDRLPTHQAFVDSYCAEAVA